MGVAVYLLDFVFLFVSDAAVNVASGGKAVAMASGNGHLGCVQALLERKADLSFLSQVTTQYVFAMRYCRTAEKHRDRVRIESCDCADAGVL